LPSCRAGGLKRAGEALYYEWVSAFIGGVAGAIINSLWQLFSAWFLAGRNTRLKNSEFLFQKELEAVSQFMALRRRIMPSYRFPEMEWDDACEDFAGGFERAEKEIREFISKHGAALDPTGGTIGYLEQMRKRKIRGPSGRSIRRGDKNCGRGYGRIREA
jgi:hypothetical protein